MREFGNKIAYSANIILAMPTHRSVIENSIWVQCPTQAPAEKDIKVSILNAGGGIVSDMEVLMAGFGGVTWVVISGEGFCWVGGDDCANFWVAEHENKTSTQVINKNDFEIIFYLVLIFDLIFAVVLSS